MFVGDRTTASTSLAGAAAVVHSQDVDMPTCARVNWMTQSQLADDNSDDRRKLLQVSTLCASNTSY